MKKIVFLLAAMLTLSLAHAQKISEKDVPAVVKTAFQKKYATIKEVKWEKEDGNFEAGFKENGKNYSVLLDINGNILETEAGIGVNELPDAVKSYISKTYPGQKIKEAAKITNNHGVVTYEAEVKGKDLIFDNAGTFLKEEAD